VGAARQLTPEVFEMQSRGAEMGCMDAAQRCSMGAADAYYLEAKPGMPGVRGTNPEECSTQRAPVWRGGPASRDTPSPVKMMDSTVAAAVCRPPGGSISRGWSGSSTEENVDTQLTPQGWPQSRASFWRFRGGTDAGPEVDAPSTRTQPGAVVQHK
jgi:hypothetical protein